MAWSNKNKKEDTVQAETTPQEDIYIASLKYMREQIGGVLNEGGLQDHLRTKGYDIHRIPNEEAITQIFASATGTSRGIKLINLESYFNLLQYEELQEARQSSEEAHDQALKANRIARAALWITAVSLLLSVAFSILSLNSKTEIDQKQINSIINEIKKTTPK